MTFICFSVYIFFGTPRSLVDMMDTMQALELFENGDYMVIYADTKDNTQKEVGQYLWGKQMTKNNNMQT